MKQILTIFILFLVSCDNRIGVEFIVQNDSRATIDSVRISTVDKKATIVLFDIQEGQSKQDLLDMSDILNSDGEYLIEVNESGHTRTDRFGYFSNGIPLDKGFDISFQADTIVYRSIDD